MSKKFAPVMTIRLDANTDLVTVDGVSFDRSAMTKDQKRIMRKVVVEALFPKRDKR